MIDPGAPPWWAESILRVVLKQSDRDSVSGDLLEEYRDAIVPARGRAAADVWYIRQVAGFLWRATFVWALLFSGAFVVRTAYDWLVPTQDFVLRSEITTITAIGILLCVGFWAAWRSGSIAAGIAMAVVMTLIAAVFSVVGASALLAFRHDPATMTAIAGSGGIEEVYVLPFMATVPALIIGTVAGVLGSLGRRIVDS